MDTSLIPEKIEWIFLVKEKIPVVVCLKKKIFLCILKCYFVVLVWNFDKCLENNNMYICWLFIVNMLYLYRNITVNGEGLQILGLCSSLMVFEQSFLSCLICCDRGLGFCGFIRWSRLVRQSRVTWDLFLHKFTGSVHF